MSSSTDTRSATASDGPDDPRTVARHARRDSRGPAAVGLTLTLLLVAAAIVVPRATGWQVWPRLHPAGSVPPLHALWDPRLGPGTLPAVVIALAGLVWGRAVAARLSWGRLLLVAYAAALAWLLSLALVDGGSGLSRVLDSSDEYLPTARRIHSLADVHDVLMSYVDRIPFSAGAQHWPIHVAGHPPGMLLFFVLLVWVGLGSGLTAGIVVTLLAATVPLAVLILLRVLGRESVARSAAAYLVLAPTAVFAAVSADAVMAAVVAWGVACLAVAGTRGPRPGWPWAVLAGLLLGAAVMMSYGLPLAGVLALTVVALRRAWWVVPVAGGVAAVVVLAFAVAGFSWWDAYPVLVDRYWDGLAHKRPGAYWLWGDLAALALSAGPAVGAGLGCWWAARRDRVVAALVGAAAVMVALADLSGMSRAEVERIWLPFAPWLILALTYLPPRWRRPALALQLLTALLVQHLLYTTW